MLSLKRPPTWPFGIKDIKGTDASTWLTQWTPSRHRWQKVLIFQEGPITNLPLTQQPNSEPVKTSRVMIFAKAAVSPFVANTYRFYNCKTLGIICFLLQKNSISLCFSTQKRQGKIEGSPQYSFPWDWGAMNFIICFVQQQYDLKCKNSSSAISYYVMFYCIPLKFICVNAFQEDKNTVCTKHCL